MNLKKILAGVAASALAVSAMSVCVLASEPVKKPESYEKPPMLITADTTVPDELYGAGVEVTFNLTVNDVNGGWANGSAGIIVDGDIFTETKFGGTACDAASNRSWFPEGSVVIAEGQKTATVVCKADLTGKSGFNLFIFSGQPSDTTDNGFFTLDSVTIKNDAGFEATYADGKLTAGGAAAPAEETGETYNAHIFFADGSWTMDETAITVTANGTYTIDTALDGFSGLTVFVVDIDDLGTALGVSQDEDYDMSKCTFSDVKVVVDGEEVAVDNSKLLWGDVEDNGRVRLEIYNEYGKTKDDPGIDKSISGTTLSVTFTISAAAPAAEETTTAAPEETTAAPVETTAAPEETTAPAETTAAPAETTAAPAETTAAPAVGDTNTATADKNNADTGIEGVAAVAGIAILAVGAVIIAKKRK